MWLAGDLCAVKHDGYAVLGVGVAGKQCAGNVIIVGSVGDGVRQGGVGVDAGHKLLCLTSWG